jgi:hypothetical protein
VHEGFSVVDEKILGIFSSVVKLKVEQMLSVKSNLAMQQEVVDTIKVTGLISTQRSQGDLVKSIKLHLPEFFGFEGASLMFYDIKS